MNHKAKQPNIVLLTVDCLRYDRCGFNGHHRNTTPALDSLTQESYLFDAAIAPGPRTSESIPGILGGILSADCDYYDSLPYKAIPSTSPTLASWLSEYNYNTIASVTNPQLSPLRNFDQGFDKYENLRINHDEDTQINEQSDGSISSGSDKGLIESLRLRFRDSIRNKIQDSPNQFFDPGSLLFMLDRIHHMRTQWYSVSGEQAISHFLSEIDKTEEPFFGWAHLNDLHAPIHPGRAREGNLLGNASNITQYRWDLRRLKNRHEPNYSVMYDSTLRYVDKQIRRVIDHLVANEEWDETIFIVTADHGEALYDRGFYGHAAGNDRFAFDPSRDYMFEELLHVPLLVRIPESDKGQRITSPFSLVWIHELLADILGIDRGDFLRMSDQEDHFDTNMGENPIVLADALSSEGHTIAVYENRQKRISQCLGGQRGSFGEDPLVFDLSIDPGERNNLSDIITTSNLDDITKETYTNPNTLQPISGKIDPETEELLEVLGYKQN